MWIEIRIISFLFFFSSRRRHTRFDCDWSSDVCSSDLEVCSAGGERGQLGPGPDLFGVEVLDHPRAPPLGTDRGGGRAGHDVHTQGQVRSEEHTSELQSQSNLVCRLLLEKNKKQITSAS